MNQAIARQRSQVFRYAGLDVTATSLVGHYQLDGLDFSERVDFEGVDSLETPAIVAVAQLWYLLAGLSYYKAGAAHRVDVGPMPLGEHGRALLVGALQEGLAEFAYRNQLPLGDVVVEGGTPTQNYVPLVDTNRVLIPFGGGIDSVVTVEELAEHLERALFVVSPASGRFTPLEETAQVTKLPVVRVTRTLDPKIIRVDDSFFVGHVPVTAMVTLLACVAALASGRGGVAMSNEHSSSVANLRWLDVDVNHQWSKSWRAEELLAEAVAERVGREFVVASFLRDRSELWVAQRFSRLRQYHHVFRSCNLAFSQRREDRANAWCATCDKCLFVNLVLAPFLKRAELRAIFNAEPLSDPARRDQLRTLVGLGDVHKPFECVGDPDESAVALQEVSRLDEWSDVAWLDEVALLASPERDLDDLLERQGPSRVPTNWLR